MSRSMSAGPHLAIDIGASGGRHILGWLEDGLIRLEEVYRFPNGMVSKNDSLCWDTEKLFEEIITGMKKCKSTPAGATPVSVGIDTWGVDFVLLDKNGNMTSPAVAYRDNRTEGMDKEVFKCVPEVEMYAVTGIQKQIFNTVFQLMALRQKSLQVLEEAEHLLMMPDYLHYKLCGIMKTEYTEATTTGLVNAATKTWDDGIIDRCGFPRRLFGEIVPAGTVLGGLTDDVRELVGFPCTVVLPPTHDTGSAFLAVPAASDDSVYISSGTWSLMGLELEKPNTSEAARAATMTNEGGYGYRYRFLKNIMGLWILQSVHREIGAGISFDDLVVQARNSGYPGVFDVNEDRFFAPDDMAATIRAACAERGFAEPQTPGDYARCICRSLALSYAQTVKQLQTLTGKSFNAINIIGGGSKNTLLNEMTAEACALPVYAGPAEGTALGNIISQMLTYNELPGVSAARETVRRSFNISEVIL